MKKYFKLFLTLFAFSAFLSSCESDDDSTPDFVTFASESQDFAVTQNGNGSFDVTVYTNKESGSSRTFNIDVLESSTLGSDAYDVPASVTVPGGSNEGTFTVNVSDTNIGNAGETLILGFSESNNFFTGEPLSINVTRDCPSDLAGTYSVLSSGQSTDPAAPDPVVDLPYTVTLTKTGDNTYSVSDIFAGVYIDWYCEAYGLCAETEGSFTDVCGSLSSSFTEPFGEAASISGTNNGDGTLTVTFQNAYGDTATSVYTKM